MRDLSDVRWKKSSRSGASNNRVEVADPGAVEAAALQCQAAR